MCEEIQKYLSGCGDIYHIYWLIIKENLTKIEC